MARAIQVYQLFPNSIKEKEYLRIRWNDGRLTVSYVRHESLEGDEIYAEHWSVECPEPLVTERRHKSANLLQVLGELEQGGAA